MSLVKAEMLAHSISPRGIELFTFQWYYPRPIHAEALTHRVFSRNAMSSRAIPVRKMIEMVRSNPWVPAAFGKNQKGMQSFEVLNPFASEQAREIWLEAAMAACDFADKLEKLEVHKQYANRLLEPFQWYTSIFTGTEWSNFLALRDHKDAMPEIQQLAQATKLCMAESTPRELGYGDWHLPLVWNRDEEQLVKDGFDVDDMKRISAGRCGRVSYLTHDGQRAPLLDIDMCNNKLIQPGHMSPLEHQATPVDSVDFIGNFKGWKQFRKFIPHEYDFSLRTVT